MLVAAAVLAGCGSDSGSNSAETEGTSGSTVSSNSSGPLTKAEFIKQANQICRDGSVKKEELVTSMAKLATDTGKPPSTQAVEKLVTAGILPLYEEMIDQLAELEAPKGEEAAIDKMVTQYRADLATAESQPVKATKENLFTDGNDASKAYGLACRL
jgi:hypothetical protein